jgi:hypothetical protein
MNWIKFAQMFSFLDESDSYNVEEEVFTVAFSKKNPEALKINPIPKLVTRKTEEQVKTLT